MSKALFTVGPVLSFRGVSKTGQWQVTALVGVVVGAAFPVLSVDGHVCPAPKVLLERPKETILRYDLSCDQQAQERTVKFGVGQEGPQWQFSIPGRDYAPRMAYVSCNGFSDPSGMRK